jgi:transcriptional regulator GlxA family with amidase domain
VQSAIEEMRRRMALSPPIAVIATAIGTTERALRASFHESTHSTPSAYFKRMRLEAVRRALLRSSPHGTTVTRVARDVGGFVHMGRFAGDYLQAFGEHPGESLRRGFAPHPNATGAVREDWCEAVDPVWPEQRAG